MDEAKMGLQTSRDQAALSSLAAGAIQLKQIQGPEKKRQFLISRIGELRRAGTPSGDSEEALQMLDEGRFDELEKVTDQAIQIGQRLSGKGEGGFTLSEGQSRFGSGGGLIAEVPRSEVDNQTAGQREFASLTEGLTPEEVRSARLAKLGILPDGGDGGGAVDVGVAQPLVEGLPESVQAKGLAAFEAAGGGKDGVKALQNATKIAASEVSRQEIPQLLDASFPNASPAERAQLEAAATSGKTVESG